MGRLLKRIRSWITGSTSDAPSFEALLLAACDEPMPTISAEALLRSLSLTPSGPANTSSDAHESIHGVHLQSRFSTSKAR